MVKKKRFEEERKEEKFDTEGWQVIYTGFALIMLSLFIMLCSYSTMESSKVMRFSKSFVEAVSILSGGAKMEDGLLILPSSAEIVAPDPKMIQNFMDSLKKAAREAGFSGELQLNLVGGDIHIRLPDNILFRLGEAAIERSAYPLLSQIAGIMKSGDYNVRIEGHTDNLPINTSVFPSNWELSTARAVNVLRFFHERERIDSNRLSAVGLSEYRPVGDNNTIDGRRLNRRVEIIFENIIKYLEKKESGVTSETQENSGLTEDNIMPPELPAGAEG